MAATVTLGKVTKVMARYGHPAAARLETLALALQQDETLIDSEYN